MESCVAKDEVIMDHGPRFCNASPCLSVPDMMGFLISSMFSCINSRSCAKDEIRIFSDERNRARYAFPLRLTSLRLYLHSQIYMEIKYENKNKISETFRMGSCKAFILRKNGGHLRERRLTQKPSWRAEGNEPATQCDSGGDVPAEVGVQMRAALCVQERSSLRLWNT